MELCLFFVALVPCGDLAASLLFLGLKKPYRLSVVERALLGFYVALGTLYVVSYIPGGWFYPVTVVGLLVLGGIGWLYRFGKGAVRTATAWSKSIQAGLREDYHLSVVLALSFGLLLWASWIFDSAVAPNTFDGGMQIFFQAVLLHSHSAAQTLEPYAPMGVTYPQGSPVVFATASILLGWSILETPIAVPPLFIALFLPAAYLWVERIWGRQGRHAALVLVVFLALVETWPRFLVGGSYDFLLSLPLLFLLLGLANGILPLRSWEDALLLGLGAGALGALSVVSLELLCTIVVLLSLYRFRKVGANLWKMASSFVLFVGVSVAFLVPSILGVVRWWGYPDHVWAPTGGTFVPNLAANPPLLQQIPTFLDPFLFRPQDVWLSPFFPMKVLLAVMLIAGILVLAMITLEVLPRPKGWGKGSFFEQLMATAGASALIIVGGILMATYLTAGVVFTNLTEVSLVLFFCYGVVALVPILWALNQFQVRSQREQSGRATWAVVTVILLALPVGAGVMATAGPAPIYLTTLTGSLANVTPADFSTLQWSGSHLPSCSTVFVAPGSAAQFLPAYVNVHVDFPMVPGPRNASYTSAVGDLDNGTLNNGTLQDLRTLGVTEVFVTGQSNLLWRPLLPGPLSADPTEFPLLDHVSGSDAYLFEFEPIASAENCLPT